MPETFGRGEQVYRPYFQHPSWYEYRPSRMVARYQEETALANTSATQAHRIISQVVFTGARVFGRAFAEAYKQASASQVRAPTPSNKTPKQSKAYQTDTTRPTQKYAAASGQTATNTISSSGLTLDEACRILNVTPPKGGQHNLERVHEQFKRLFDMNDPKKGGSFYLQSKVLRARERIELEVREAEEARRIEEELKGGWKPRVYRD